MNILFWNLNKKSLYRHIKTSLSEKNIDIAIFAEYENTDFDMLQRNSCYKIIEGFGGCEKIIALSKNPISMIVRQEQSRYILYEIQSEDVKYVLAGIHLQDKRSSDKAIRLETIRHLKLDILKLERKTNTKNTIIIGDFNSNPYDRELLQMDAFDAVLFRSIINHSETHTVNGIKRRRFYNPILHFINEDTKNYGSFYYDNGSYSPIWNCLDQVLLSKSISDKICELEYIKEIGSLSLMNKVKPKTSISDHLPLYVKIIWFGG